MMTPGEALENLNMPLLKVAERCGVSARLLDSALMWDESEWKENRKLGTKLMQLYGESSKNNLKTGMKHGRPPLAIMVIWALHQKPGQTNDELADVCKTSTEWVQRTLMPSKWLVGTGAVKVERAARRAERNRYYLAEDWRQRACTVNRPRVWVERWLEDLT